MMSLLSLFEKALQADDQMKSDRHSAVMLELKTIKEILMALTQEVQDLHDAVAAQGAAINDAVSELTTLESSVATLQAQVAALQGGGTIASEDLAEIVANTNTIAASVNTIRNVLPVPVVVNPVVAGG